MIVYQSNKSGFLADAFKRDIEEVVLADFKARTGRTVARNEIRSWKESLLAVAKVLNDDAIPGDCGVAIEFGIPQTAKRIDFMLSGQGADNRDELVIIELKQWASALKTDKDGIVRTRFAGGEAETSHPSYQAWSYGSLLTSFNEAVYEGGVRLRPCAYLHNYVADHGGVTSPFYADHLARAPVFLKGESEKERLREFIKAHVRHGERQQLLFRIEHGRIRPSKGLVDSLTGMLAGIEEFVLIDDQKVVYETALQLAAVAATGPKQVVIVEGGPGTGKSVVAINLLVALNGRQLLTKYVTKNAAPRAVFESKLTGAYRRTAIANLFSGSGAFVDTRADVFDALVVDEAHRLNKKSGLYGNLGTHQVAELIGSAKCTIFFIDEDQRIHWKDVGQKSEIMRLAKKAGAAVTSLQLESQFRCNGSNGYLAWLDNALGIRPTANEVLERGQYDFRVFDSPEELRKTIVAKNAVNNRARMVAGYCWDWQSKKRKQALDVTIPEHGFGMQWNLAADGSLWIIAPESAHQIGCIHTCQGLEVDYIGVVVGPDLVVRDGRIVTRPEQRSKHDQSIKGYKALFEADPLAAKLKADAIIKNTYRTLMTRGMKGCYVYCTDPETGAYIKSLLVKSD